MKILCAGEVVDNGYLAFRSVATLDEANRLVVAFEGALRIDNPYRYLQSYINSLEEAIPQHTISSVVLDYTKLAVCNDNTLYALMDIADVVTRLFPGHVLVRRLASDDWQQAALPILVNVDDENIAARTSFEDVRI